MMERFTQREITPRPKKPHVKTPMQKWSPDLKMKKKESGVFIPLSLVGEDKNSSSTSTSKENSLKNNVQRKRGRSESGSRQKDLAVEVAFEEKRVNQPKVMTASTTVTNKQNKKRKHHSLPRANVSKQSAIYSNFSGSEASVSNNNNRSTVSCAQDFQLNESFKNLYASARLLEQPPGGRRPIAIDGCNVAWGHGNEQEFSYKGIVLCADYFRARGHAVKAFVPRHHQPLIPKDIVEELIKDEILVFTPSRNPGKMGKRIAAYDDRFIVQYAVLTGGVVISNDNFNDLYEEQPAWRETITNRVLQHTWISKDILMFQLDPMGRRGRISLEQFLTFPLESPAQQPHCKSKRSSRSPSIASGDVTPAASSCISSPNSTIIGQNLSAENSEKWTK